MITVIDYGAGNLHSVENTLKFLNVPHRITSSAADVSTASALLLPGVGHFGQMMRSLEELKIASTLRERIHAGVPYLGICLGMHALFERSDEAPEYAGLGIFPGSVRRFPEQMPAGFKVPHMGWNQLNLAPASFHPAERLFDAMPPRPFVYFAHSYYLPVELVASAAAAGKELHVAVADYNGEFIAALEAGNVFGTQFHPEKSGDLGLRLMASFAAFCDAAPNARGTSQRTRGGVLNAG